MIDGSPLVIKEICFAWDTAIVDPRFLFALSRENLMTKERLINFLVKERVLTVRGKKFAPYTILNKDLWIKDITYSPSYIKLLNIEETQLKYLLNINNVSLINTENREDIFVKAAEKIWNEGIEIIKSYEPAVLVVIR